MMENHPNHEEYIENRKKKLIYNRKYPKFFYAMGRENRVYKNRTVST